VADRGFLGFRGLKARRVELLVVRTGTTEVNADPFGVGRRKGKCNGKGNGIGKDEELIQGSFAALRMTTFFGWMKGEITATVDPCGMTIMEATATADSLRE
jgi:hypothetical protein